VTSHVGRVYVVAVSLLVFFVMWAAMAAKPWTSTAPSPQAQVIALREQVLRRETQLVNQILRQRAAVAASAAKVAKAAQTRQLASASAVASAAPAPSVRVVTLPPLTITRTS
jgi:hypothetical protein